MNHHPIEKAPSEDKAFSMAGRCRGGLELRYRIGRSGDSAYVAALMYKDACGKLMS